MLLSPEMLRALTGRARREDQAAWLEERGIPFQRDGLRILVAEKHVEGWLAGQAIVKPREPNLAGVR